MNSSTWGSSEGRLIGRQAPQEELEDLCSLSWPDNVPREILLDIGKCPTNAWDTKNLKTTYFCLLKFKNKQTSEARASSFQPWCCHWLGNIEQSHVTYLSGPQFPHC